MPLSHAANADCGALVIGGALGSLALIRSLGRRGIPVEFLSNDNPIAGYSRFTRRSGEWPGPDHPEALEWLSDYAERRNLGGWVLFPGGDPEVLFAALHHDALSDVFRVTTPPMETTRWTIDKRLTYQRARDLGLASPLVYMPGSRAEVEAGEFVFPVVLKPKSRDVANDFTAAKAWRADDRRSLLRYYDRAVELVGRDDVIIQEYVPGGGWHQFSYAALWSGSAPLASLVARRLRQYPIDFGYTSTYVETCENDVVREAAERFLSSLPYSGLVEIEFKYDPRSRNYKILDVNPRLWNWISLGSASGADFPDLAFRFALGSEFPPVRAAPGVGWIHAPRDVPAAWHAVRSGSMSIGGYLTSLRRPGARAVFACDDPLPALLESPLVTRRLLTRRLLPGLRARGGRATRWLATALGLTRVPVPSSK